MLIDANLLIYAVDRSAHDHDRAAEWLQHQLNGDHLIGIPWESLSAFLRITTNPRASLRPLKLTDAWAFVEGWLAASIVWVPQPTERHREVFGGLLTKYRLGGNLIPDAHITAIAIEHGLDVCSADTDFARFTEVRWRNPLVD